MAMGSLKTKTLNNFNVIGFSMIEDKSEMSKSRTDEVQEQLSALISLARKRGRPSKGDDYE
jgi:hypothetical protein